MTDYKPGDTITLVRIAKDGRELGRFVSVLSDRNEVQITSLDTIRIDLLVAEGWRIESVTPAPEPMPKESGAYADKDGEPWLLLEVCDEENNPAPWLTSWGEYCSEARASERAPFTPLVPDAETRADERAKVLAEVLGYLDTDTYIDTSILVAVAKHFGIEVPDE